MLYDTSNRTKNCRARLFGLMLWPALPSVGRITLDFINGMRATKSVRDGRLVV